MGVDALAATGAEERVRLQPAFQERGFAVALAQPAAQAIGAAAAPQPRDGVFGFARLRAARRKIQDQGLREWGL